MNENWFKKNTAVAIKAINIKKVSEEFSDYPFWMLYVYIYYY